MSRLSSLAQYIKSVYRCGLSSSSWLAVMRSATSKRSRSGNRKGLGSEGTSHFEEHHNNNKTTDHKKTNNKLYQCLNVNNQNDKADDLKLSKGSLDPEVERLEYLAQKAATGSVDPRDFLAIADFDEANMNKLGFESCEDLDKYALLEAETALAIAKRYGNKTENNKTEDIIEDSLSTVFGDQCDAIGKKLGIKGGSIRDLRQRMNYSGCSPDPTQGNPNAISGMRNATAKVIYKYGSAEGMPKKPKEQIKPESPKFTPSYRPFPVIEVPISAPEKKEKNSQNDRNNSSGVKYSSIAGRTEINADMKDPDSRQLVRFALLRALHRLESGNGKFSAKIIITDP